MWQQHICIWGVLVNRSSWSDLWHFAYYTKWRKDFPLIHNAHIQHRKWSIIFPVSGEGWWTMKLIYVMCAMLAKHANIFKFILRSTWRRIQSRHIWKSVLPIVGHRLVLIHAHRPQAASTRLEAPWYMPTGSRSFSSGHEAPVYNPNWPQSGSTTPGYMPQFFFFWYTGARNKSNKKNLW